MFTRSIGDAYMKHPDVTELYNPRMDASHKVLPPPKTSRPYIINTPEVRVREVQPGDSFVIVASDGLWDVVGNQTACEVVLGQLAKFKAGRTRRSAKASARPRLRCTVRKTTLPGARISRAGGGRSGVPGSIFRS